MEKNHTDDMHDWLQMICISECDECVSTDKRTGGIYFQELKLFLFNEN